MRIHILTNIIFRPSSFVLITTSFTHLIFNTFSSPLMPSQFKYMLPKSHSYPLACSPIFIKQIHSLSRLILDITYHTLLQNLHHPTSLSSSIYLYQSICIHQTPQHINSHSVQSHLWHIYHTHFFSSNSICFSLVRIFLTFFHTTFTVDDFSLPHIFLFDLYFLSTPILSSFLESFLVSSPFPFSMHPSKKTFIYSFISRKSTLFVYTVHLLLSALNSTIIGLITPPSSFFLIRTTCCCLPTPLTLVCGGGESDHPGFLSTRQLIPPSGQQLHHSSGVCPQIQG